MRVIAGVWGGRPLVAFKGDHLRPTTERIKGSIFNTWMPFVEGARVLDLYAGTGSLGIEALSRGASQVVAVESHEKSLTVIRSNMKLLGISKELQLIKKDVISFLKGWEGEGFDLILIDPPFTQKIADQTMKALADSGCWLPHTRIVIESASREVIRDQYGKLILLERKNFSDKKVSHFAVGTEFNSSEVLA